MKRYILVICLLLLLVGCNETNSKNDENSNNKSNTSNIEVKNNSNIESNIKSNITINTISNKESNKTSNTVSNKTSQIVSNKTSQVISNKSSQVTSNTTTTKDKTGTTSKGYTIEKKNGLYYIKGLLIANKTYDLPSTYNPGGLLPEFNTALNKMKSDYDKQGFTGKYASLEVVSGFRSYQKQVNLYNRYVARDGKAAADRYSARPGYSEHQTGLAADLVEISDSFGDTKAGKWLANNCWKYGFILRYPKGKEDKTGYMYESWHFRYIGDVDMAKEMYNNGNWISLEEYLGITSKYDS